jgi:hypothetical protein
LYYYGENFKSPPPTQISLHRRAALTTNSNGTQPAKRGKEEGGGLDNIFMSMGLMERWASFLPEVTVKS